MQKITSAKTSGNRMAAGFKKIKWFTGTTNLDIGGGKYDKATDWLAHLVKLGENRYAGVKNVIYDPYNRTDEFNQAGWELIQNSTADTVTCFNVLNVIKEIEDREVVIEQIVCALKPGGMAFISVYEGDKSGIGKETPYGWQENRRLKSYIPEFHSHMRNCWIEKGLAVYYQPLTQISEEGYNE